MIERPETTFQEFAENGLAQLSSPSLRKDHIVSVHKETNRLVDDYTYYIDKGGLFWLTDDEVPQKIYIRTSLDASTPTRKRECEHFDKLEDWALKAEDGVALWFSPDTNTPYPCSKAILHKLGYSIKKGFNAPVKGLAVSSINIDIDPEGVRSIIRKIFPNQEINTPEELRSAMIILNSDQELSLFINEVYKYNKNIKDKPKVVISQGEIEKRAWHISNMFPQGYDSWTITQEMKNQGLLGNFSISCGAVSVTQFSSSSETTTPFPVYESETYSWHSGVCRICGVGAWVGPCEICNHCASKL